jgi:hypothetical protein
MEQTNTNAVDTEVMEVEVYEGSEQMGIADKTLEQLVAEANAISTDLCTLFGIAPVAVEIEGTSTRVKMQRIRGGYKIDMGLKAFLMPKYKFIARLIHELVHVYHDSEYIVDTCGNGAYHTEVFADQIKKWGCVVAWSRSYGFAGTVDLRADFVAQLDGILAENIDEDMLTSDTAILYKAPKAPKEPRGSAGFKAKIYKVTCPICNEVFYVQKDKVVTEAEYIAQNTKAPVTASETPASDVAGADLLA